jgi:hypothetical protein
VRRTRVAMDTNSFLFLAQSKGEAHSLRPPNRDPSRRFPVSLAHGSHGMRLLRNCLGHPRQVISCGHWKIKRLAPRLPRPFGHSVREERGDQRADST